MKKLVPISLLILFAFSLSTCLKSTKETLPPITMEGKNVVACYINGELYIYEGEYVGGWSSKGNWAKYIIDFNSLTINSKANEPLKASIWLKIRPIEGQLVYELNQFERSIASVRLWVDDHTFADSEYKTNAEYKGHLELLKFRHGEADGNNFVAGTFSFDAIDSRGDVIEVREGRFDIAFNQ